MALAPTNKPWSTPEYILPHIAAFGKLKASDVVMDCGCGDARVLVELARSHKCKCIGWEISPPRLKEAYLNIKANNCGSLVEIENIHTVVDTSFVCEEGAACSQRERIAKLMKAGHSQQ